MAAGEGIASPTGRDIDGKYLDMNEKDLKDRYAKFQNDWPIFGVSLMCDSWTDPTRMSVINFLIYCNGVTWFHKSIDATGKSQDSNYLKTVTPKPLLILLRDGSKASKLCNRLILLDHNKINLVLIFYAL
jgi:hypothetical protein